MKKYFFLLFLFIIYIILISNKNVKNVSLETNNKNNISNYKIIFNNGINSKKLQKIFNLYNEDYLFYKIDNYEVSCDNFNNCINEIYDVETLDFELNNIINGFKIDSVELIISKENIQEFLKDVDSDYQIY